MRLCTWLPSLAIVAFAIAPCRAALTVVETPVSTDASDQIVPAVHGNAIVWEDYRSESTAGADLWRFDIQALQAFPLVEAPYDQIAPFVRDSLVVFQDNSDFGTGGPYTFDIWRVPIGGAALPVTQTLQDEESACLVPGRVVFARNAGNGNWNIIERDLTTSVETPVGVTLSAEQYPSTSARYTVFSRLNGTDYDLWAFDRDTNATVPISTASGDQWLPWTDGQRVVWEDWRNASTAPDIYMYDFATQVETPVCTLAGRQQDPVISGNYIVWSDRRSGQWKVYLLDLATGEEQMIAGSAGSAIDPRVDGNVVVWRDRRFGNDDVYMATLARIYSPDQTIGDVRLRPDGTAVDLSGKIATRDLGEVFGIQEPDRSAGILVRGALALQPGSAVAIKAVLQTLPSGERILEPLEPVSSAEPGDPPKPLGLNNLTLCGDDFGAYTPGADSAVALNTVGNLVRTWGRVTASGDGWFTIADGSDVPGGVRVECAPLAPPQLQAIVAVTGIARLKLSGEARLRMIQVSLAEDIEILEP